MTLNNSTLNRPGTQRIPTGTECEYFQIPQDSQNGVIPITYGRYYAFLTITGYVVLVPRLKMEHGPIGDVPPLFEPFAKTAKFWNSGSCPDISRRMCGSYQLHIHTTLNSSSKQQIFVANLFATCYLGEELTPETSAMASAVSSSFRQSTFRLIYLKNRE